MVDGDDVEPSRPLPVDPNRARRLVGEAGQPVRKPLIHDPELEAMRAADRARDAQLHPFSDEGKRRLKMYILGSMVFFPLVTYVLTPAGLGSLWFQLLIAIAYGTFVALCRPAMVLCAVTTVLAGLSIQAVCGVTDSKTHGFLLVLSLFLYGTVGLLLGFNEHSKQIDR